MADAKWSHFPSESPDNADEIVGLHSGHNARFSVANFILAVRQGLANIFVPNTRKVNNKVLSSDITLTASDVGAMPSTATLDDIPSGTTYAKPTATQVAQIGTNQTAISAIEGKIPSAASPLNQLADKDFVADSITQGTAIFRGSFATRAALLAVQWQTTNPSGANYVSNNDYAVVLDDESQNDECWRYIYVTGTGWTLQYRINESPLTQAQLDAINSGATAAIISSVGDKLDKTGDGSNVTATFTAASTRANISTGEKLSVMFGKIAKWFVDLGTAAFRAATGSITQGSTDLVESGAVYTGLTGKQSTITASGILKGDGAGGVSAATAGTDYASPSAGVYYGRCNTAGGTAAKEVTISGITSYYAGLHIRVRFDNAQEATGKVTLNVNNLGALELRRYNSGAATAVVGEWRSGTVLDIEYQDFNTPYWIIVNSPHATTDNYGRTILSSSTSSSDTDKAATPSAVKAAYDLADGKYTKPSGGIPASDIASGVIPTVPSISTSTPNMDGTGAAGSTGEVADAGHVHPRDTTPLGWESIFSTVTDVHSDTTITLSENYADYKFLVISLNTRSANTAAYRMGLLMSPDMVATSSSYAIANQEFNGYVRIISVPNQPKQLRFILTDATSLYVVRVYGIR